MSGLEKGREVGFRGQPLSSMADWEKATRHIGYTFIDSSLVDDFSPVEDDETYNKNIEMMDGFVKILDEKGITDLTGDDAATIFVEYMRHRYPEQTTSN